MKPLYKLRIIGKYCQKTITILSPPSSLLNSADFRSCAIISSSLILSSSKITLLVASSITNPSCAENRNALMILSGSSEILSAGLPTQRIILRSISSIPPKKSWIYSLSYANALIVKSRLLKSSSRLRENSTLSGRR